MVTRLLSGSHDDDDGDDEDLVAPDFGRAGDGGTAADCGADDGNDDGGGEGDGETCASCDERVGGDA